MAVHRDARRHRPRGDRGGGGIDSNGIMSSETIVLTGRWTDDGQPVEQKVGGPGSHRPPRMLPVFPTYRLDHQFDVIRMVGGNDRRTGPPRQMDRRHGVGARNAVSFLMDHVDGIVPPDVHAPTRSEVTGSADAPPSNPAARASGLDRRGVGEAALDTGRGQDVWLPVRDRPRPGPNPLRRHFGWLKDWYAFAVPDIGAGSPRRTRLELASRDNFPDGRRGASEPVAGVGLTRAHRQTCCTRDFRPVAVLDWEMATVGPREPRRVVDRGSAHMVFQELGWAWPHCPDCPTSCRERGTCGPLMNN